jgi:predicted small lipoprotein YifL/hydrogenase maturation factor
VRRHSNSPRRGQLALLVAAVAVAGCRNRGPTEVPPPKVEAPATERTILHPSAPVTVTIPLSWRHSVDEGALTLTSGADEVVMILIAIPAKNLEESLEVLNDELGAIVKNAEITAVEETEVGGMAAMVADGVGKVDDQPVNVGLMLLRTPDGRILLIVGLALEDASEEASRETAEVLQSLRSAG